MMPNPEPLTARAISKGKQKLLLTSEHVSWCPPEFVESVRTRNLSRANELHFRGYETGKKERPPSRTTPAEGTSVAYLTVISAPPVMPMIPFLSVLGKQYGM